jgi:sugar phosphate isomerase/epimerase
VWLTTDFEGGRHIPRLAMLDLPAQESWDDAGRLASLDRSSLQMGVSLSPESSIFGPLIYAGNLKIGIEMAARLGFDGVELSLRDPDTLDVKGLHKLIQDTGLKTAAIATGQSCLHDGLCLLSAEADKRKQTLERLRKHLRLAEKLGAHLIVGGVRGRSSGNPSQQQEQKASMNEAVAVLAAEGRSLGVTIVIEPINRYETNYINTIDDGLAFIEEIGDTELKLVPDTFHMNIEEGDMTDSLVRAGSRIGYMHFADSNRRPAGQGHTNFVQVLAALVTAGYRGMITSEVLPLPDDDTAMAQAAGFMKALLGR